MVHSLTGQGEATSSAAFWQRLLHRWFIEFNPLYLVSAALVLGGMNLISRGLARGGTLYGEIGVTAIAELYAWALIAGAALLTRMRLRRPAVMLALLALLYQCDLTLHTATCAYLGTIGIFAAVAWLASFICKLYALAWAVELRPSRSAIAVPIFGALGLATLPRYFGLLDAHTTTTIVGLWVFALFASGLWTARDVSGAMTLDAWGRTVLERARRATWVMWMVLTVGHVLFWSAEFSLEPSVLLPVALLLSTRWMRGEAAIWCVVSITLLLVGVALPSFFSVTAIMAAVVLSLRAFRQPLYATVAVRPEPTAPYRAPTAESGPPIHSAARVSFATATREAMLRLLTGALFGVYMSVWTTGWSGGHWPMHLLPLDLLLTATVLLLVWKAHARVVLAPLAATYFHLGVQRGAICAPESILQWGMTSVALGFGLLVASLVATWRLRHSGRPSVRPGGKHA
jgi:hypothetical protein